MAHEDGSSTETGFKSLKDGSTDSAAIAAYYDNWAGTYETTLTNWDYQAPSDAAQILSEHISQGDKVLDVGCGIGMVGKAISERQACKITGIDISASSLELAEKQGVYDSVQRHDLQTLPLPASENDYAAAICVGVLTYIEDEAGLFADMCRVVRPGGHILFTQRDDRWSEKGFAALIEDLEKQGLWNVLMVSKPKPYLPQNDDYSDAIRVIYVLCRVV